jgi:hypothetical protein
MYRIFVGRLEERGDHFGDLGIIGRIILKLMKNAVGNVD